MEKVIDIVKHILQVQFKVLLILMVMVIYDQTTLLQVNLFMQPQQKLNKQDI